ncbi:MAG: DHHA1 domain-containing protein, partial [Sedimenticola sp.]|nr:DHHA1 domain-containing protein [Sedimenticola sp.]
DTWKHEYRDDILALSAGLRMQPQAQPRSRGWIDFWKEIMSGTDFLRLKILKDNGKIAYQAQRTIWDQDCWNGGTAMSVNHDLKMFIINSSNDPSLMFTEEIRRTHDVCVTWYYHYGKRKYKISCRSIDGKSALELAKHFGGGGHGNAAGAWVDREDWSDPNKNWIGAY